MDDIRAMPSRRFLALADRLPAYGGVLSAIVTGERYLVSDAEPSAGAPAAGRTPVPATRESFARDPELRGLSSFSEVPKPAVLTAEQQAYLDKYPELQAPPRR